MIRSCIQQIGFETERLQSQVSVVSEGWNDQVSAYVERTYVDALISACNSFYTDAYSAEGMLRQHEELLQRLADKY